MNDSDEVAPWLAVIERLWDDRAFEAKTGGGRRLKPTGGMAMSSHSRTKSCFWRCGEK